MCCHLHATQSLKLQSHHLRIDSDNNGTLIGQYCVVRHNNKPHPGCIIEVDETDVKVACMHSIGTAMILTDFSGLDWWRMSVSIRTMMSLH